MKLLNFPYIHDKIKKIRNNYKIPNNITRNTLLSSIFFI